MAAVESRARSPEHGLRQRLRMAIRATGFSSKFTTELMRNGALKVIITRTTNGELPELPFDTFEGRSIVVVSRKPSVTS